MVACSGRPKGKGRVLEDVTITVDLREDPSHGALFQHAGAFTSHVSEFLDRELD